LEPTFRAGAASAVEAIAHTIAAAMAPTAAAAAAFRSTFRSTAGKLLIGRDLAG
jgi:hypothetical protein